MFAVMMVMKGMSYALNNPTKEILYQVRGLFFHRIAYIQHLLMSCLFYSKLQRVSSSNASPGLTHSVREVQRLLVHW